MEKKEEAALTEFFENVNLVEVMPSVISGAIGSVCLCKPGINGKNRLPESIEHELGLKLQTVNALVQVLILLPESIEDELGLKRGTSATKLALKDAPPLSGQLTE